MRLTLAVVAVVVALAAEETLVRLWYSGKYGPRPGFYVSDPECTWRPAAHLHHTFFGKDFGMTIETDRHGYRLGELGRPQNRHRLVLLSGDSHVFGWGVSTEQTCASVLDELLAEGSEGNVRLVNLGVGGYGNLQSAKRLEQFLRNRPRARPETLIFVHSHNDMSDNADLRRLGVMLGLRAPVDLDMSDGNASRSHLVNFARRTLASFRRTAEAGHPRKPVDEAMQDVLWAFHVPPASQPMPAEFRIGRTLFRTADLSPADANPEVSMEHKALSRIQTELMEEAIYALHDAVRDHAISIYHTFIYTAPDWYVNAVSEIARRVPSRGNTVHVMGRIPEAGSHTGPVWNTHAGSHYTPALNRLWAQKLYDVLRQHEARLSLR